MPKRKYTSRVSGGEKTRKLGIGPVDAVPWGTHITQFYDTKQDLLDILVPYFKTGLENNEFCIWVTSEALDEKEAEEAMRKAVASFDDYLRKGQIEIFPHTEWYLKGGVFNAQRVLNTWIDKVGRALDKGYDGMRITGDTAWLVKGDWGNFTAYEEEVNSVIGLYPLIVICTYPLGKCGASEIIDVIRNHKFTFIREVGGGLLVASSEYSRVEHELAERRKELGCLYAITKIAERLGITLDEVYQQVANLLPHGWQYPEITCAKITIKGKEFRTGNYRETEWRQSSDIKVHGAKIGIIEINYLEARPEVEEGPFLKEERLLIDAVARRLGDITEHKSAREGLGMTSQAILRRYLTPLQQRFVKLGFEGLNHQEPIELLLSLVVPHQKCKRAAKECIKQFKNLRGLLAASPEELQQVGLNPYCICGIKLLHELPTEILKQRIIKQRVCSCSKEVFDYLYYSMRDLRKEVFKAIYLNSRNQIIDTADLFEGTVDSIPIRPREIVESAMEHKADAIIFAHNHPSGDPEPSRSDKQLTRDLVFIGNILLIKVLDHIIIGENRYFSFADEGLIQRYQDSFLNIKIRGLDDASPLLENPGRVSTLT